MFDAGRMAVRFIWCSLLLCPLAHSEVCLACEEGEMSLLQHIAQRVVRQPSSAPASEPYWSSRGGGPATRSSVDFPAPDISRPSWVWPNELNEQVRHSPLIDVDLNIYVTTTTRVRKFDSNGKLLWTWQTSPGRSMSASPALYQGHIYVLTEDPSTYVPTVVSLAMENGTAKWNKLFRGMRHNNDAASLSVYNGTVFFGIYRGMTPGTDTVVAARASDGTYLWEYQTDELMWNFSPSTPGDGTLLFSSSCGAVFRLSAEGKLLWRAGRSMPKPHTMCVPGGGALGPNGVFYVESSPRTWIRDESGSLAAYNVADGSQLWARELPLRAAQSPAVGRLGPGGPLAVVAALGDNPMPPVPPREDVAWVARVGPWRNAVLAVDAATGETLWRYDAPPYYSTFGAGELDLHNASDGSMCWPDSQGIPLIAGDGRVFASSSLGGELRSLRDDDGDGLISPSEIVTFETHKCFLNSPSIAPGMLVAAPCWGPIYVFKDE